MEIDCMPASGCLDDYLSDSPTHNSLLVTTQHQDEPYWWDGGDDFDPDDGDHVRRLTSSMVPLPQDVAGLPESPKDLEEKVNAARPAAAAAYHTGLLGWLCCGPRWAADGDSWFTRAAPQLPARLTVDGIRTNVMGAWHGAMHVATLAGVPPRYGRFFLRTWGGTVVAGAACGVLAGLTATVIRCVALDALLRSDGTTDAAVGAVVGSFLLEAVLLWVARRLLVADLGAAWAGVTASVVFSKALSSQQPPPEEQRYRYASGEGVPVPLVCGPEATHGSRVDSLLREVLRQHAAFESLGDLPWGVGVVCGAAAAAFVLGEWAALVAVLPAGLLLPWLTTGVRRWSTTGGLTAARLLRNIAHALPAVELGGWERGVLAHAAAAFNERAGQLWSARCKVAVLEAVLFAAPLAGAAACVWAVPGPGGYAPMVLCLTAQVAYHRIPDQLIALQRLRRACRDVRAFVALPEPPPLPSLTEGYGVRVAFEHTTFGWRRPDPAPGVPRDDSCPSPTSFLSDPRPYAEVLTVAHFTAEPGACIAVVGESDGDKTAFLHAILGQHTLLSGAAAVTSNIGFAPKDGYVCPGTVADNITMGREWNDARLRRCVEASGLGCQLEALEDGLTTPAGKGLTPVQVRQVSLARALYAAPNLLVLDDPLDGLPEVMVGAVFKALQRYCREDDCTVVAVLNQAEVWPACDRVVLIEDKAHRAEGRYHDLLHDEPEFLSFVVRLGREKCCHHGKALTDTTVDDNDDNSAANSSAHPLHPSQLCEPVPLVMHRSQSSIPIPIKTLRSSGTVPAAARPPRPNDATLFASPTVRAKHGRAGVMHMAYTAWARPAAAAPWTRRGAWVGVALAVGAHACVLAAVVQPQGEDVPFAALLAALGAAGVCAQGLALAGGCEASVVEAFVSREFKSAVQEALASAAAEPGVGAAMDATPWSPAWLDVALYAPLPISFFTATPWLLVAAADLAALCIAACCIGGRVAGILYVRAAAQHGQFLGAVCGVLQGHGRLLLSCMRLQGLAAGCFAAHLDPYVHTVWLSARSYALRLSVAHLVAAAGAAVALGYLAPHPRGEHSLALCGCAVLPMYLRRAADGLLTAARDGHVARADPAPAGAPPPPTEAEEGNIQESRTDLNVQVVALEAVSTQSGASAGDIPVHPPLENVSIEAKRGERVAVVVPVGPRGGVGWLSAIGAVLFRSAAVEGCGGRVLLDGKDAAQLPRAAVRQAVAWLPAAPVWLSASVHENMDPFREYPTRRVLAALRRVGLDVALDDTVDTWAGRQLVLLARAMMRRARVVVLEEPLDLMDPLAEAKLQGAVRAFEGRAAVITIARRLNTVLNSHRVYVLDPGCVAESGPPTELLDNPFSLLHRLMLYGARPNKQSWLSTSSPCSPQGSIPSPSAASSFRKGFGRRSPRGVSPDRRSPRSRPAVDGAAWGPWVPSS